MATFYVDSSATINGVGTLAEPFTTLALAAPTSGNTYYVRRIAPIPENVFYGTVLIPSNVNVYGWPMPGDPEYDSRPAVPGWDADLLEHAEMATMLVLNGAINVYVSRIWVNIEVRTGTQPSGITALRSGINIYRSANVVFNLCKVTMVNLFRGTDIPYNNVQVNQSRNVRVSAIVVDQGGVYVTGDQFLSVDESNSLILDLIHQFEERPITTRASRPNHTSADYGIRDSEQIVFKLRVVTPLILTPGNRAGKTIFMSNINELTADIDLTNYPDNLHPWPLVVAGTNGYYGNGVVYIQGKRLGNIYLDMQGMTVHARTNAIVGIPTTLNSSGLNTIRAVGSNVITVYPLTVDGTVSITSAYGTDITCQNAATVHIDRITKSPLVSISGTAMLTPNISLRDVEGKLKFLSGSGSVNSTRLKRSTSLHGYRLKSLTSPATTAPYMTMVGNSVLTPYIIPVTAGGNTVSLHMAAIPKFGNLIRPGDIVLILTYTDGKGEQMVIGSTLTYNNVDVWEGLPVYKPCMLSAHITPDIDCSVRAVLRHNAAGRYTYILLDDHLEVVHD